MRKFRVVPVLVVLFALGPGAAASRAGNANGGLPGAPRANPLAGMKWGAWRPDTTNTGVDAPGAYFHTTHSKRDRATFGKLIAQPRFRWLGAWIPTHDKGGKSGARATVRAYIDDVTGGNPNVGAQIAVFRVQPWEGSACTTLPSHGQKADFKAWIKELAKGIGSSRVAIDLQPDMPFILCLPHHSGVDYPLIAFAARTLNALPHTTVYIDAGAADWLSPARAAKMLKRSGVKSVRGFSLNVTHYGTTHAQVAHGKAVIKALAHRGVPGKHFIVNTVGSGHPFVGALRSHKVCASGHSRHCVALGPPPTTNTHSSAVDGELWIGRPWFDASSAYAGVLRMIRTSPYF